MLYKENVPYLLTLLFSALAWTVSLLSEDALRNPVLEYTKNTVVSSNQVKNTFMLTNISSDKALSGIVVKLRIKKEANAKCLMQPEMQIFPPTELSDPNKKEEVTTPEYIEDTCSSYRIPKLQPGANVQIAMYTDKKVPVDIYVWSGDAVKVVETSLSTKIVKNKFSVLVFLIILWSSLIVIYIFVVNRRGLELLKTKEVQP